MAYVRLISKCPCLPHGNKRQPSSHPSPRSTTYRIIKALTGRVLDFWHRAALSVLLGQAPGISVYIRSSPLASIPSWRFTPNSWM